MKKVILCLLISFLVFSSVGQQLTKEEYLQKSKAQKTWGWILTGGGAALIISGAIISSSDISYFPSETVGPVMIGGGAAIAVGGIVLLSASKRNERKANEQKVTFNLKLENSEKISKRVALKTYYPALSMRIPLN
ncbi:MAG TPA: hypothetical protein VFN30_00510 [Chitinophagaceae bacterium]|nr:hypothetical protein [Chitinophagaceae bacterium]